MNKNKGFTLTEVVITMIIVGILALIAVPVYRSYVREGIATEGKALLGEINAAQQVYYSRNGQYYAGTAGQQTGASFGVDARRNKYFTSYDIERDGDNFTAYTEYEGKKITLKGSLTAPAEIIDGYTYEEGEE